MADGTSSTIAAGKLKSFVERIERLEAEKAELAGEPCGDLLPFGVTDADPAVGVPVACIAECVGPDVHDLDP